MSTPWFTVAWAGFIAATAAASTIHAIHGARTISRRYRLAWTDPGALIEPARHPSMIQWSATVLGWAALLLAIVLLVSSSCHSVLWVGPVLSVGGLAIAGVFFRSLQRTWSAADVVLAAAMLTIGSNGLTRTLMGPGAHLQSLVLGFAIAAALWAWLSRVWLQQLDGGAAWTVAGRLVSMNRLLAGANCLCGVITSLWLSLGPTAGERSFFSVTVIAILLVALTLCLRRWWGIGFLFLLLAGLAAMMLSISHPLLG